MRQTFARQRTAFCIPERQGDVISNGSHEEGAGCKLKNEAFEPCANPRRQGFTFL
jgi:hypothetical protein